MLIFRLLPKDFVLEKQMSSFRSSNILIINTEYFHSAEEFCRKITFIQTNKQVFSSAMFSAHSSCVADVCGALGTGNQIPRWPEFGAM